jgi:hypothetical protein
VKKENRSEAAQFFRDSLAQLPTSEVLAKRRAELIENLALLVVRKHRREQNQPSVLTDPSSSAVPPLPESGIDAAPIFLADC